MYFTEETGGEYASTETTVIEFNPDMQDKAGKDSLPIPVRIFLFVIRVRRQL